MLDKTQFSVNPELLTQAREWSFKDQKAVLNEPTGNFFYDPWQLKNEYRGTVWEELLNTLPTKQGEARVIYLQPGETYMAHSDIDDRWHLNISGNQSYLINVEEKKMYFLKADCTWYDMDAGKIHVASNFGEVPRIQLVVRQLLKRCDSLNQTKIRIEPAYPQFDYRYKFDNKISPWLNKLNKFGFLNNFTFNGDVVEFTVAGAALTTVKEIDKEEFKVTYE